MATGWAGQGDITSHPLLLGRPDLSQDDSEFSPPAGACQTWVKTRFSEFSPPRGLSDLGQTGFSEFSPPWGLSRPGPADSSRRLHSHQTRPRGC